MAHINLLPWREELRQERKKNFYIALAASFVFAAIALYGAISFVDGEIANQEERNKYLKQEITKVERQIKEIEQLERQREKLLARMQVIQELQASRPKIVRDLNSLAILMPDGVDLDVLTRKGKSIEMLGSAESNGRVSLLMKSIDENEEFQESTLNVVQNKSANDSEPREFKIQVSESVTKNKETE
jgi:type IV pilus assembly protein PilN